MAWKVLLQQRPWQLPQQQQRGQQLAASAAWVSAVGQAFSPIRLLLLQQEECCLRSALLSGVRWSASSSKQQQWQLGTACRRWIAALWPSAMLLLGLLVAAAGAAVLRSWSTVAAARGGWELARSCYSQQQQMRSAVCLQSCSCHCSSSIRLRASARLTAAQILRVQQQQHSSARL
jgi:hypothetical protein